MRQAVEYGQEETRKMSLSEQNVELVRHLVSEYGDQLKGKLPPLDDLPNRNPYAHLWKVIKTRMGKSYKECDDSQMGDIVIALQDAFNDAMAVWLENEAHPGELGAALATP